MDSFEQSAPRPSADSVLPLPPLAVPEALDSLDWAWRLGFEQPLFERPQLTSVADATLAAAGREDLVTRLSNLANVLDAARVDDILLPAAHSNARGALNRMKLALGRKLTDPDKSAAQDAVDELRAVVQLRVALQHKTTTSTRHPDQETALARLGLDFPANPSVAWERVRRTVVDAAAAIRRALRAQLNYCKPQLATRGWVPDPLPVQCQRRAQAPRADRSWQAGSTASTWLPGSSPRRYSLLAGQFQQRSPSTTFSSRTPSSATSQARSRPGCQGSRPTPETTPTKWLRPTATRLMGQVPVVRGHEGPPGGELHHLPPEARARERGLGDQHQRPLLGLR